LKAKRGYGGAILYTSFKILKKDDEKFSLDHLRNLKDELFEK